MSAVPFSLLRRYDGGNGGSSGGGDMSGGQAGCLLLVLLLFGISLSCPRWEEHRRVEQAEARVMAHLRNCPDCAAIINRGDLLLQGFDVTASRLMYVHQGGRIVGCYAIFRNGEVWFSENWFFGKFTNWNRWPPPQKE